MVRDPARYSGPASFFPSAARALVAGLPQAEVGRLVATGLAALLPGPDGVPLLDAPGFPSEARSFCLANAAGLEVLRRDSGGLDWVHVSPAGDFDHAGGPAATTSATTVTSPPASPTLTLPSP